MMHGIWWTIVQIITLYRPIAALIIYSFKFSIQYKYILLLLIFVSDFIDGKLARQWNVVSKFGSLLDPICDKIAIYMLFTTMVVADHKLLFITLIIKDLLVLMGGIYTQYRWRSAIYTNLGRSTMFFTAIYIISYMLNKDFNILHSELIFIKNLTNLVFFLYILEYIKKFGGALCKNRI